MLDSNDHLSIIHAGALAQVIEKCLGQFSKQNPGLHFTLKAVGSREAAKSLLSGEKYDIIALADQALFAELLVPDLVQNYYIFAADQIVIAYNPFFLGAQEITAENWVEILLSQKVRYARSDHHLDPCGYRTLMVWQLAEKYYAKPGLYAAMDAACIPYTAYPKSLDLANALAKKNVDCAFLYSSQAEQLGLSYVSLPAKINLSNPAYADYYDQATVLVESEIGKNAIIHGKPIEFAVGLAKDTRNFQAAKSFIDLLTGGESDSILEECGFIPC